MPRITHDSPRYDMLFSEGLFNGTLLIGPDPLGANFDFQVFLEAKKKIKLIGLRMTDSERGLEEYQKTFNFNGNLIKVRIRLVLGRNYQGNLKGLWREALANDDLIYLKTHAGYGRHLSLSDDVSYFTDAMKNGSGFETIVSKMNDEYGIPHFDEEDDPADMRLDRKMVTYSTGKR